MRRMTDAQPADAAKGPGLSADDDRVAIARMLADKNTGRRVRELAQKALDGNPEDLRYFLEVGQFRARFADDQLRALRTLASTGAGDGTQWAVGGAAVALGAGAGLVLVNRRRTTAGR
ncbi:ALF repeat-containing protein [Streptomyces sp. H39-S7]|uniref:ALF repeat-containing protein n=1 Tax=Streptomyces sp. H39-S7 TaxID=3004357 RepID=UPI0022AE6122|nr:ALF repeat-containing protein [Streptomyces sp. H39-S7]MCZ4123437.1 ALF repeat-containing protein [Streptomyces sp. H39-S7]